MIKTGTELLLREGPLGLATKWREILLREGSLWLLEASLIVEVVVIRHFLFDLVSDMILSSTFHYLFILLNIMIN
jgi:hypothetical protein